MEYVHYAGEGDRSVTGQAFLKTRGGDVKFGAGNKVICNPVTSYSSEWYQRAVLGGELLEPAETRALRYSRTTIADGEGRFRFDKLPSGRYYLVCWITWEAPNPRYTGNPFDPLFGDYPTVKTGGAAAGIAEVDTTKSVSVILTR